MILADLLGSVGGALTTLSFLPQVIHTLRTRDVSSLSLGMYAMFTTGVALWVGFGLAIRSWPVVITNGITLILATLVLTLKLRYGRESKAEAENQEP